MPKLATRSEEFLNETLDWEIIKVPLSGHQINKFKALFQRIDVKNVSAMVEASKDSLAADNAAKAEVRCKHPGCVSQEVCRYLCGVECETPRE